MTRKKIVIGSSLVLAAAALSAGIAVAASGGSDLDGAELKRATAAALASTGGGRVLEAEAGDDGSAYEVEVRTPSGKVVEVQLDRAFHVIGSPVGDDDSGNSKDDGADADEEG